MLRVHRVLLSYTRPQMLGTAELLQVSNMASSMAISSSNASPKEHDPYERPPPPPRCCDERRALPHLPHLAFTSRVYGVIATLTDVNVLDPVFVIIRTAATAHGPCRRRGT